MCCFLAARKKKIPSFTPENSSLFLQKADASGVLEM
jgi:hypothetical protein